VARGRDGRLGRCGSRRNEKKLARAAHCEGEKGRGGGGAQGRPTGVRRKRGGVELGGREEERHRRLTDGAHEKIEALVDITTGVECLFWTSIFCSWSCK
jgi:hypothetical protein